MSYLDVYKKKMQLQGGSTSNERKKMAEDIMFLNFKDDPSYRDSTLTRTDLTTKDMGIRVVNTDSKPNEKKLYVLPNEVVSVGDYISYTHKDKKYTYLIDSFEDNLISPCAKGVKCRNILKWIDGNGEVQEYPCVVSYQSYGVKIFQNKNDFAQEVSTNIDVEIPRNSITETIPLNLRVIFGNSRHGIYKVGDIATYEQGILKLTCKKDEYFINLDDIENGLAYNSDLSNDNESTEYIISGSDSIRKGQVESYEINNSSDDGSWEIEDYSGSVEVISKNAKKIEIKCNIYGDFITLKYVVSGEIKVEMNISLSR